MKPKNAVSTTTPLTQSTMASSKSVLSHVTTTGNWSEALPPSVTQLPVNGQPKLLDIAKNWCPVPTWLLIMVTTTAPALDINEPVNLSVRDTGTLVITSTSTNAMKAAGMGTPTAPSSTNARSQSEEKTTNIRAPSKTAKQRLLIIITKFIIVITVVMVTITENVLQVTSQKTRAKLRTKMKAGEDTSIITIRIRITT
jgi:hypothetical protein